MFGLGFWEMVVIGIVVLIFIQPRDLPAFFRKAGRLAGQIRSAYDMFMKHVRDMENEVRDGIETGTEKRANAERDIILKPGKRKNALKGYEIYRKKHPRRNK
jgi:Sec-independent protein translocase protein TatA